MFGIFDALVEDVAIFAHGSLRAPACFGEVVCFHQCTLLEHGDDVRGDVSRALSGDVLARCLLIPCGMLSHVSCFLVSRNLGAFPMLLSVNVILTTSRARLRLEKTEGTERSRDRARHRHRQVRSPLQRAACVACKRVLAPVCLSSFVDEPAKMLLFALHHVVSKGSVPCCNCGIWTECRQAPTRACIQWLGQCSRRSAERVMNVGCPVAFLDALLSFWIAIMVLAAVRTVGTWALFLCFSSASAGICRARHVRRARTLRSVHRARDAGHA